MNINKTEALEESKRNHMTRSLELKRDWVQKVLIFLILIFLICFTYMNI